MRVKCYILMGLISLLTRGAVSQEDPFYPEVIDHCLEDPSVKGKVEVMVHHNPVYLRGDFDGDGRPDYALEVRKPKAKTSGILVCTGNGKVFLLGMAVAGGKAFSDMPGDDFIASS